MKFSSITTLINRYIARKAATINHSAIIKDITQEGEISAGYFGILTLANLIALSGLIQNSVPVVIGAMLISPLMGPILSFGFAFITGDKTIWRNSLKKIVLSVAVTIIIASIATFFSPLKEITGEILARTKPNLYDLLIAFFSGLAGAVAICTKKSYLTIVPGVAIATAVIPPLSVTGFGLGTADFGIMTGSFLLFFTNFVAIVISTCIVFYMYGFKPSMMTEEDISALKKRVSWLAVVLLVISIPLIYTLEQSISEVRLRAEIKQTLKQEFDKQGASRLAAFRYTKKDDGTLEINATINTVNYLKEADIDNTEKRMKEALGRNLRLYMEQVRVQPGGLKETVGKGPVAGIAAQPKAAKEIIRNSRADIIAVARQSVLKIEKIISPSSITDFSVGFRDKTPDVLIALKIKKDASLTDDEIQWLKKIFAADLNAPVVLSAETVPFVPALVFRKGETEITAEMKSSLTAVKDIYKKESGISILVEAWPESSISYNRRIRLARERLNAIAALLTKEYGIPEAGIILKTGKKAAKEPSVRLTIDISQNK